MPEMATTVDTGMVLSIVYADEDAFRDLSIAQLKNLMLVSKEFTGVVHDNVNKYLIKHYVTKMYKMLHSNIVSLVCARNYGDIEKEIECHMVQDSILQDVYSHSEEVDDSFIKLFIAEYKELIYGNLCDPCFERIEYDILKAHQEIIYSDDILYDVLCEHEHDQSHYMFRGEKSYEFDEKFQQKGYDVADLWENSAYNNEEVDTILAEVL